MEFSAGKRVSGAERHAVVWACTLRKQGVGAGKRGERSFSRPWFSENQQGGHTAAMAHSEVIAESVKVE